MAPRYPDIQVRLHSQNPYALVSAVRMALRQADIDDAEVVRFTEQAFEDEEPHRMRKVCENWAQVTFSA